MEPAAILPADLESAHAVIEQLRHQVGADQREIERLRHRIEQLTQRLFGRRSEKGLPVPEQGVLAFPPAAGTVASDATDESPAPTAVRPHVRRRHVGRRALPPDLPRQVIELAPAAEALQCPSCQSPKTCIGTDRTETLEFEPAAFFIREYVRPKYACRRCADGVTQAVLPARPIEKGRPEPGLLAHVVSSKYADHLPLYRLEQIFERHGIAVTRRTLAEWNGAVADLLEPVAAAVHRQVLGSRWVQSDDTTVEVQDPEHSPAYRTGHLWVYRGEQGDVAYDFTWQRNRDGPLRMLGGYRGFLQVDAAPAYDEVFRQHPEIVEVGCWAHARRYFKEALPSAAVEAAQVVAWIGELYGVERRARDRALDEAARQELRRQQAVPVLARLRTYLEELQSRALPKSPLGQAVGYARKQWQALCRYAAHGLLEIDNNGAERAIKPLVLGRKNWLFIGSEAAAHRTAVLCTLVNTCKAHQINPFAYLRDVIERVSTHPMRRVEELTPREWKRLRQASAPTQAA